MSSVDPLQTAFWLACEQLIFLHTTPWELDEALTDWGYTLGPCEAQDLVGLDCVLHARRATDVSPILKRMVSEGRLGKKGGWGYYRYPGGGGAVIDPLIDDLVREEAWFTKVSRNELTGEALVKRLHDVMRAELMANPEVTERLLHLPSERVAAL